MKLSEVKKFFPLFTNHPDLVYLDSAATALKPESVLLAQNQYYTHFSANTARGIYPMAEQATEAFEKTRTTVASFIGARPEEIIFTSGTTASLNLVADLLSSRITAQKNIVVTALEHHSNFLPWKELARKTGATLRTIPITAQGELDETTLATLISNETSVVALSAVSNVLGIINPVKTIIQKIRALSSEVIVVVDAAQAIGHMPVDVTTWDADFVAFSGHKLLGPTGTGILFGKQSLLETLRPVSFGGGMVLDACATDTLYKESPACFEAGTQNIAGFIGLGAAIEFIETIGLDTIHAHENALALYTIRRLKEEFDEAVHIIGETNPSKKSGIVSFVLEGIHPHDTAQLLGERNICVRAGLQCASPLHESLHLSASTRISLSLYNTEDDIEKLIVGLKEVRSIL
ncbi:MAG: aminotransferase class V-fold PLP-dependent enzyme [Candidatus Moranbacteria bacterium]|nr:aminotransferase class V-fold PLP-dependent enzyme [Candidatus Moranbacteria bacterium]